MALNLWLWENGCFCVRLPSLSVSRTCTFFLPLPPKCCPEEFKGYISVFRTSKCLAAGSVFLRVFQGGSMRCTSLRYPHWHVQTGVSNRLPIECTAHDTDGLSDNMSSQTHSASSRHTWFVEWNQPLACTLASCLWLCVVQLLSCARAKHGGLGLSRQLPFQTDQLS